MHYGMFMSMVAAMGSMNSGRRRCVDELEGVDIEAEYALIQQKKSRLSRRLRERVCYIYNSDRESVK